MPTPAVRNRILRAAVVYQYLARWLFGANKAAPITSPYTENGASLTITDTENKLSISGGKLVCAGGKATPGWGDPGAWGEAITRAVGKALLGRFIQASGNNFAVGWDINTDGNIGEFGFGANATNLNTYSLAWGPLVGTQVLGTEYEFAVVLRGTGAFAFIKGGTYTNWTLLWISNSGSTATLYPVVTAFSAVFSISKPRVVDLGRYDSRWGSDYGIATSRLVNPAANATATHTPDAVIESTFAFNGTTSHSLWYRIVDANNRWYVFVAADGSLALYELAGGVANVRASAVAGTVSVAAHRLVLVTEGNKHTVYLDNVLKAIYTDPSNLFLTATGMKVNSVSGGVSEVVCWPRVISLPGQV